MISRKLKNVGKKKSILPSLILAKLEVVLNTLKNKTPYFPEESNSALESISSEDSSLAERPTLWMPGEEEV